jgi:hypothetical protein
MAMYLPIFAGFFSIAAVVVTIWFGPKEVQALRKQTGDRSALTAVLSGSIFHKDKGRFA